MSASTYLLGVDLGTSGVKALLLPVDESRPYWASQSLSLSTPYSGWSEQDPHDWWHATVQVIRTVLEQSKISPANIVAMATSGQMHGATVLDRSLEPLRPCILWNDQRSIGQCDWIMNHIGLSELLDWVANPALAGFTAPKLLWMREHESALWSRARTVLLPKDYLNLRLTGSVSTDVSDASGTLLFDVAKRNWSEPMLRALNLPTDLLPAVHQSSDVIGQVTSAASRATGLRQGMPVVAGGADNACAAVGMGVVRGGQMLASLGTSGTLVAPTARPRVDAAGRLHTFCHAVPDTWYVMGVVLSAGGSLRWYRDTLAEPEVQRATADGRDPYELIMDQCERVPAGCDGLLFLPYLTGERTPHGDPNARGVFFGLSLRHTRAHLARSVVEGVTYALADSADLMRDLKIAATSLRATGGGARSSFWLQMLADVLETQVHTAATDMGPSMGAAVIAGAGTGVFSSIPVAIDRLITIAQEYTPHHPSVRNYQSHRTMYQHLYPALREVFRDASLLPSTSS